MLTRQPFGGLLYRRRRTLLQSITVALHTVPTAPAAAALMPQTSKRYQPRKSHSLPGQTCIDGKTFPASLHRASKAVQWVLTLPMLQIEKYKIRTWSKFGPLLGESRSGGSPGTLRPASFFFPTCLDHEISSRSSIKICVLKSSDPGKSITSSGNQFWYLIILSLRNFPLTFYLSHVNFQSVDLAMLLTAGLERLHYLISFLWKTVFHVVHSNSRLTL